jgi:hypothetical protein
MQDKETKKITVEAIADGKNFAGSTQQQQTLTNNVKLTCSNTTTSKQQDPKCDKGSKTNITVRRMAA